jgi:hypothetical protein
VFRDLRVSKAATETSAGRHLIIPLIQQ